jgi:hypothetical protein
MPGGGAQAAALLSELDGLQRAARDGVVHLTEASFARFADGPRRPYHLVVFLTASHLLDKTALGLRELRYEFGLLAKARPPPAAAWTSAPALRPCSTWGAHEALGSPQLP